MFRLFLVLGSQLEALLSWHPLDRHVANGAGAAQERRALLYELPQLTWPTRPNAARDALTCAGRIGPPGGARAPCWQGERGRHVGKTLRTVHVQDRSDSSSVAWESPRWQELLPHTHSLSLSVSLCLCLWLFFFFFFFCRFFCRFSFAVSENHGRSSFLSLCLCLHAFLLLLLLPLPLFFLVALHS